MTELDYASKVAHADRLVNDPEVMMDAAMVWRLMDEISNAAFGSGEYGHEVGTGA